MVEQRDTDRIHKHYPVLIQFGGQVESAISCDVSDKGISLFSRRKFQPGDMLHLTLLPDDSVLLKLHYSGEVQWCSPNDKLEFEDYDFVTGIEYKEAWGEPIEESHAPLDRYDMSRSIYVNAPADLCYRMVCDFERYPEWQKAVVKVLVRERFEDGRPKIVQWFVDMILKQLTYTNIYRYDDPNYTIYWELLHGDIRSNKGCYRIKQEKNGGSTITFEFSVELGFPAPQKIIDFLSTIAFRKVMQEMKRQAESLVIRQHEKGAG